MTDQPNIQLAVLEYVYEHADGPHDVVHLRDSPLSDEHGSKKVAEKAAETGVFNWGINALHPWYEDESEIRAAIEQYGSDPESITDDSSPDTSRGAMVERGQKFDALRSDEADWVADCVADLWDNPQTFESGNIMDEPEGVDPVDFNLFRFGVIFGIEYEQRYPVDSDDWRGDES